MYSSLQQKCLVELGITPFDLNDKYKTPTSEFESSESKVIQEKQPQSLATSNTSSVSKVINTTEMATAVVAEPMVNSPIAKSSIIMPAVVTAKDQWLNCAEQFLVDIKVIFPEITLSVLVSDCIVAQLTTRTIAQSDKKVFWKIAPKVSAQYVQQETIGQDIVITSPLPNELSVSQKKELWLLLQPYSIQSTLDV